MPKILRNELEGLYACPLYHPETCANPKGFWKIEEIKIELRNHLPFIWIRNEGSMWFRADQCYISDEFDCQDYIAIRNHEQLINSLTYSYTV